MRPIPAINRVVCQMCVSATLHQNQLQRRSDVKLFTDDLWNQSTSDIDIHRLLSLLTHVFKYDLWLRLTSVYVCVSYRKWLCAHTMTDIKVCMCALREEGHKLLNANKLWNPSHLKNTTVRSSVRRSAGPPEPSCPPSSWLFQHTLCPASRTSNAAVDPWSSPPQTCNLKGLKSKKAENV